MLWETKPAVHVDKTAVWFQRLRCAEATQKMRQICFFRKAKLPEASCEPKSRRIDDAEKGAALGSGSKFFGDGNRLLVHV